MFEFINKLIHALITGKGGESSTVVFLRRLLAGRTVSRINFNLGRLDIRFRFETRFAGDTAPMLKDTASFSSRNF